MLMAKAGSTSSTVSCPQRSSRLRPWALLGNFPLFFFDFMLRRWWAPDSPDSPGFQNRQPHRRRLSRGRRRVRWADRAVRVWGVWRVWRN